MTSKFSRTGILLIAIVTLGGSVLFAQRTQNRPAPKPEPVNIKIRYKTTVNGQSFESVSMIKGTRERSEMKMAGMDTTYITQCDLKRSIQLSDKTRKYMITPMDSGETSAATPAANGGVVVSTPGGVINYVISSVDTGERKDMFGFKARHVKTATSIESSPDACSPAKMRTETDGWYIDLSTALNCDFGRPAMAGAGPPRGGCRDRVHFRHEGTGRTGYPLSETTTMFNADGSAMFTSTKEVIELSQAPLDAALFDVPAGYSETTNAQELYGMPSMEQMMSQASGRETSSNDSTEANPAATMSQAKRPGMLRIGVVQINNTSGRPVSTESLRGQLIGELQGSGVDAVALNASSPAEAEAEAKAK
ncbi:MAG TPA: hypothetical protein VJT50_10025, partial [Pyrinomonadaceae bacterium]|nr:hypothetical protein [Pyrinomonadaceae bacterium]